MSTEKDGSKQSKGGHQRAENLSADERKRIAQKAARSRWAREKDVPEADYTGELEIGGHIISCAVLEDGRRILSQGGFLTAIGRSRTPKAGTGSTVAETPPFLAANNLKPYLTEEIVASTQPLDFLRPDGRLASGYLAEALPRVCDLFLKARDDDNLSHTQQHIARHCDILMRGLAHTGIIALVDEATGYQAIRHRKALEKILEQFISQELLSWAKRFPDEFYREIFRLKGWEYSPSSVKRPQVIGHYTNDLIYDRLAPGVLDELRKLTPKDDKGRRKHRFHQHLTEDVGHPKLHEHLIKVIALMNASRDWEDFCRLMNQALPRYGNTIPLPLNNSDMFLEIQRS